MKIGFFSDTHFGFGEGTVRAEESFENAMQGLRLCFEQKVDLIVIPGDIFDEPFPSPDSLSKAFDVFLHSLNQGNETSSLNVVSKHGEKKISFFGVPIVVIHGNHDYSGIGKTNILEVFSKSKSLVYVPFGKVFFEKNNEKVCVNCFSYVPDKKAFDVLKLYNPVPENNCVNVLVMHQTFKEFLPFVDDMIATLSLDDLPKGFDIVVNGHLHWTDTQKLGDTFFVLAGSTVTTQMKKLESERDKGVFVFDSQKKSLDFFSLPRQRKLFYKKIKFEQAKPNEIVDLANNFLSEVLSKDHNGLLPLVRLKLEGSLALGVNSFDVDLSGLFEQSEGKAILSLSKNFFSGSFKSRISDLQSIQKSKQSVAAMGFDLLEKNLSETDFNDFFDVKTVFDLLAENEIEEAIKFVLIEKN